MSSEAVPRIGVEEEFHLIDLATRRLTARAPELLELLPEGTYVEELQRCVLEVNSGAFGELADLRSDLVAHREMLLDAAAGLGIGVAAAGGMPLAVPAELGVTRTPRYRRMLADYQLLAREQLICGTQVHVDLPDRDEAVQVATRVAPFLPVLLALSASSPFWSDGTDTGYASMRTLVWQRWPSTGPAAPVSSAAEYDAMIADLVASGVITDPGMVYFDVRPSAHVPTLELRLCDSCPTVDTIVLIAGLFRALVTRELAGLRAGTPPLTVSPTLGRAALWRAARSGLEGDLVDVTGPRPRPAAEVVDGLIQSVRPQLEAAGDWATLTHLASRALQGGSSASRQRRALRRRRRLTDVVDLLLAETSGALSPMPEVDDPDATMLHGYAPLRAGPRTSYDEAVGADGTPEPAYAITLATATGLGAAALRERQAGMERQQAIDGVTFRVAGRAQAEVFPVDVLPRTISAPDWAHLVPGLGQRALALDAFLRDVYGERAALRDGVIPAEVVDRAPGLRSTGALLGDAALRAHISGIDLVSPAPGRWCVLEDNLRVPSGVGYALSNRSLLAQCLPELSAPPGLLPIDDVPLTIRDTLLAAAPPRAGDDVGIALLSSGPTDSAWFEHELIAERTGLPLVLTGDLSVHGDVVLRHHKGGTSRVDVLYARMDEDMLLSSTGHDGRPLRQGLLGALGAGALTIANALGNGVGDDKAVYAYLPAMIRYYLGEEPLLEQVPTWLCAERDQRDLVLSRLDELVVKPIDGFGGAGITVGPEATDAELAERRVDLLTQPERFVAQEVVPLSTHPTFDGAGFYPHHVDLRAFVHLREGAAGPAALVIPACLTRVAPAGSVIVNSSRGGGSKDTWVLVDEGGDD